MRNWPAITRDELLHWAKTPEGSVQLPQLIRRLVLETGDITEPVRIPGGSGVSTGGFDGAVAASRATTYIPAGSSVWEMSVSAKLSRKADEDYSKRKAAPNGLPTSDVTYVQVICRPWTKRDQWADARTAEGRWREVRAYNVDDIAAWLETAPATTLWLADVLGMPVEGVRTVREWWDAWSGSTIPALGPEILLAGRNKQATETLDRLAAGAGITTIGGDLRAEEVSAFVAAVAFSSGETRLSLEPTLLFVDDRQSLRRLLKTTRPLVILLADPSLADEIEPGTIHHLIVPITGEAGDIILPAVDPRQVTEALRSEGLDAGRAAELGHLARRSILALRRRLAARPELHRPGWSALGAGAMLRRVLLLNTWDQDVDGDREVVSQLIGTDYSTIEDELLRMAGAPEAPMVANLDGCWHVVSPMDAWLLLGSQLTREDLQRFGDAVREVLGEPDPTLEVASEDRWRAALDGVRRRYSTSLRIGVARSLALLGGLDDIVRLGSGETGSAGASRVIRDLLDDANNDVSLKLWTSLADVLPLLAEAAPDVFLDALEHGLTGGTSAMSNIFTDSEDRDSLTAPTSPHIHFLAALETLGWSSDHFARVVSVCARLAQLDPGGKWANRPDATLASFFCPWHPNTSAKADQRMDALDRLWRLFPNVAWELALTMLPNSHAIQTLHHGPRFRSWKAGEPVVTQDEYRLVVGEAARRLVDGLMDDIERYVSLVERADDLPPASFDVLVQKLIDLPDRGLPELEVAKVWKAVRGLVAKHREYADAKWALPEEPLRKLARAEEALQPNSAEERSAWLFEDGWVTLGDLRRRDDHQAYDTAIADRRRDAVSEVAAEDGFAAVLRTAERARLPQLVGVALACAEGATFEDKVLLLLDFDPGWEADFAFGYFGQKFRDEGWTTIDELVRSTERPRVKARLLLCTRQPQQARSRLSPLGSEVAACYWQEFSYVGLGHGFPEVEEAASQLVGVGRYAAALDLLALYSREFEDVASYAERIAEAFEGLIDRGGNDPELAQLSHEFDDLFKLLGRHRQALGAERVVRIEWFFLPALGYSPDATTLHQELAADPTFFVEMVTLRFHPATRSDDEETAPNENQRRLAENAFRLMSSWSRCPGVDDQGNLDGERMRTWIHQARELLAQNDRVDIGDQEIGQALAAAPTDPDGTWPALPVRELFEDLQNDNIELGFEVRVRNRRGVTSRDPLSGGDQERNLASDYEAKAEKLQSRWPRTAAIMRRLATSYEADARRWDDQAERRRRGLDW